MSTTVDLGKVSLSPMDEYVHGTQYEKLDLVTYQRGLFIAKENNKNILPTVTNTWMKIGDFSEGAIMTDSVNGVGHPDGQTITVDANGTFSATCKVVYVTEVPTASNATKNTLYIKGSSADGYSIYTLIGNAVENVSKMIPKYAGSSSAGGSATSAVKLQTARTIQTNLQSTSTASFDGTANVTPGVTGVLPVANGGTGQTTLIEAEKALLTSLNTSDDALIESGDYIPVLTQSGGGGVSSYTATKRSPSTFWDYIVDKIAVNLGLTASRYFGKSAGITGTLPVANGGTGTNNLSDAFQALSKSQDLITDQPVSDDDRIMIEYEVIDNNYSFVRTSVAKLAQYIQNKIGNATTSTNGLMSATDKTKLDTITVGYLTMRTLGLNGKTSSVADFFSALVAKGYDKLGVLHFRYDTANAGNITGSDITISINGCQCILTTRSDDWNRKNAIISIKDKTYNVWAQYDASTTPSESGIVDISANTWRPVQNNLTSTSTSDCLSAYQGKLLNDRVATLENASTKKLTNNSYIKKKGNVVSFYSWGGASTASALNSIRLESTYRPPYPIHIAGYICKVGASTRYPAYLSVGSDGVMGVSYLNQLGGNTIYHDDANWWFDGYGTWLV